LAYTKRGTLVDRKKLKCLYIKQGKEKREICDELSCSLHVLNRSITHYRMDDLLDRYVRFLFYLGKRQYEIGVIINRNQAAVSRRLCRNGVDSLATKKERMIETTIEKYGVYNIQKHPLYREKTTNTNLFRYGYDTPLRLHNSHDTGYFEEHKDEILKKSRRKSFSTKEFIFPSGRRDVVQGAEPLALKILLNTYHEDDIVTGNDVPVISYYDRNKNRKHYPDIYIPIDNRIIEVKTPYTLTLTKSLMEKHVSATKEGYCYEIWVFDKRNDLTEVIR